MCKEIVKSKSLTILAPPHYTQPAVHGRVTDSVTAGAVFTLYTGGTGIYSGIARAPDFKSAIDIVHRAELRVQVVKTSRVEKAT